MRTFTTFVCSLLAGCASHHFAVVPSSSHSLAALALHASEGDSISTGYDGIWSVDGRDVPDGPVQSIFVAAGKRTVGYNCPGWIFTDAPPTLEYVFEADKRYEVICGKRPSIRLVPGGP